MRTNDEGFASPDGHNSVYLNEFDCLSSKPSGQSRYCKLDVLACTTPLAARCRPLTLVEVQELIQTLLGQPSPSPRQSESALGNWDEAEGGGPLPLPQCNRVEAEQDLTAVDDRQADGFQEKERLAQAQPAVHWHPGQR